MQSIILDPRNKVWIFGGKDSEMSQLEDFFELNMLSYTWTKIQTGHHRPHVHASSMHLSLNALSETELLLYAEDNDLNHRTWILDLPSQTWKNLTKFNRPICSSSTVFIGVNRCIYIIISDAGPMFCMRLEPKSLQQLALQTISKYRSELLGSIFLQR